MSNHPKDVVIAEMEKRPNSLRIRFYWFVGVFSFAIAALVILAAWDVVRVVARIATYAITAFVAFTTIGGGVYLVWLAIHTVKHRARRDEALTRKLENEAAILVHDHNSVAYTITQDGQLFPIYSPQLRQSETLPMLPQGVQSLDFVEVMTKARRCYSIVADQQVGKTTLAHYIVEHWQQQGVKSIVIAQKYDAGEYANCEKFGPDNDSILAGFDLIRNEAKVRQQMATSGTPYNEMDLQSIFLEDFTSFASIIEPKELESFVSQALTVYAARGLLLYFIVHSKDKNAFGLGKMGASLKDQMTRLEIIAAYHANGEIDHAQKRVVCSIGSNLVDVPVSAIPTHTPRLDYDCRLSLYGSTEPPKAEPSRTESQVLYKYDRGASISQIALLIFGQQNSHNNERIKNILTKYGREILDARARPL